MTRALGFPFSAGKRVVLVVLSLLIVAATCGFFFLPLHSQSSAVYSDTDPAYNRAYWTQEIKKKGAKEAFAEFVQANTKAPEDRQHFAAHVMGGLLGEMFGADGIAACGSQFSFGCYHGLFSTVIARGGPGLISDLDRACVKAYGTLGTGCQHGIGHGILEYTGYENLNDALALCTSTTQLVPLLGCTSGVFMEYNEPLGGDPSALVRSTRAFDADTPYKPCTSVPGEFQASCYYELGGWLYNALTADYPHIDRVCGALSGSDRKNCYRGVGSLIPPMEGYDDVAGALAHCAGFSTATATLSCRAGVSWALYQVPEYRARAAEACAYPDAESTKACSALADLTEGKEHQ